MSADSPHWDLTAARSSTEMTAADEVDDDAFMPATTNQTQSQLVGAGCAIDCRAASLSPIRGRGRRRGRLGKRAKKAKRAIQLVEDSKSRARTTEAVATLDGDGSGAFPNQVKCRKDDKIQACRGASRQKA